MTDIADIRDRLRAVEQSVGEIRTDMAGVKERLNHMPTTAKLLGVVLSASGVVLAALLGGYLWIVQQWLEPILSKLPG